MHSQSPPLPFPVTETERKDICFRTKRINFFGKTITIILQNHNGPCPLIAICNVLSLRNKLDLSWYIKDVPQETLVQHVISQMMNSILKDKHQVYAKDQQRMCFDAFGLIRRLATGIDVNVKFRRIDDFEFTAERAIFFLLDIPLYHGWLVDPQDSETLEALGSKSYNTLMGELAHLETLLEIKNESGKNSEEDTVDIVAATTASLGAPSRCVSCSQSFVKSPHNEENTVDIVGATTASISLPFPYVSSCQSFGKSPQKEKKWGIAFKENLLDPIADGLDCLNLREKKYDPVTHSETVKQVVTDRRTLIFDDSNALGSDHVKKTGSDSISQKSETERRTPKESSDSTFEFVEPENIQYDCDKRVSSGLLASTADLDTLIHKVDEPEPYIANIDSNELVCGDKRSKEKLPIRQGELVKNFMKNSASQLTVFGLSCLHDEVIEHELCVFFRNNHFNTMLKYKGELYILVTDQGYLNQPDLVWEKLNEVNGNTLFMTGDFEEFKLDDHSNSSWNEPKAMTTTAMNESKIFTEDFEDFDEMTNADDYPAGINDESQDNSSFNTDLQLAMALQEMEYEEQDNLKELTTSSKRFW